MQVWVTNSLGGYMYSDNLSKELRMSVQPLVKFRQFADIKDAAHQGLQKGDTFHWNVYSDVARQGTTLIETTTVPETNFTITQGTMTITEYANSVPYTGKLDDLSLQPVMEIVRKVLKNDAKKAFDIGSWQQFDDCAVRVTPTAGTSTTALDVTTNGTATTSNNLALGKAHVKLIVDLMKERDVPPYVNDDYVAISHPSTFRPLKDELEQLHQYVESGFRMILNGEMGRYEAVRFVEQTFIPKGGAADTTTFAPDTRTADVWNNAKSSWAFFLGEDTVAEAIAIPEEMRGKLPGDYGRSKGVSWYYIGGFGIVHTVSNPTQCRIFKWDSGT
jgi:N4-gp56 family major capsid protein